VCVCVCERVCVGAYARARVCVCVCSNVWDVRASAFVGVYAFASGRVRARAEDMCSATRAEAYTERRAETCIVQAAPRPAPCAQATVKTIS
jgi:hypothetical protein